MMLRHVILIVLIGAIGCNTIDKENKPALNKALFSVKEYGKWGFINVYGEKVIDCQYNQVNDFTEGIAAVKVDSLWGYINSGNQFIIPPKFKYAKPFSGGFAQAIVDGEWEYINRKGEVPFHVDYNRQGDFKYGLAKVIHNDEVCYMDTTGTIVIRTGYPYGSYFKEGFTHVWTGDSTKYINTKGQVILAVSGMGNDDFSEGLAQVRIHGNNDYINKQGVPIMNGMPDNYVYGDFNSGLAKITIPGGNHKSGFIDTLGNIVIPIQYSGVTDFHEGLAAYMDTMYSGFINTKGDTVIEPQFVSVDYDGFSNGLCRVSYDGEWGYINNKGNSVWKSDVAEVRYRSIDLVKWDLDTLEVNETTRGGKYSRFRAKPITSNAESGGFYIQIDTSELTVFEDRYLGYKIYIKNDSQDKQYVPAQDGKIKLIKQALNEKGKWQDIEEYINSFCGNSYHSIEFKPRTYRVYADPIMKGNFNTQLRYRLNLRDTVVVSNSYFGRINKAQFIEEEEKDKTDIAVWTF